MGDEDERVTPRSQRFSDLCLEVEPRLRRALVAAYGPQLGSDAAAEALAWAWEHFEQVERMENPAGYLWRVGQTSVRREARRTRPLAGLSIPSAPDEPVFEPALLAALDELTARQRAAALLVHGYGYSLAEAADVLGCRIRTLRHHLDRALEKLRHDLGATDA